MFFRFDVTISILCLTWRNHHANFTTVPLRHVLYLKKLFLGVKTGMRVAVSALTILVGNKFLPLFWRGITVQLLIRRKSGRPEFIGSVIAKHYEKLQHMRNRVEVDLICQFWRKKITRAEYEGLTTAGHPHLNDLIAPNAGV